jgi:Tfp pilus assembly protein PilF
MFVAVLVCLLGIRSAWRAGVSSLLAKHAKVSLLLMQADEAVGTDSSNPDAHSARALVLLNLNRWDEALAEFEQAVRLRPRDYFVWLDLGRARDSAGDKVGGLDALREAVRLAPFYSKPRWQYGNLLLRTGKPEEAFAEMRRAAAADPTLYPVMVDLAWAIYQGNVLGLKKAVEPQTPAANLLIARFLIRKGKLAEGMEFFRGAGSVKEEDVRTLLNELLTAKRYREAYEVWSRSMNIETPSSGIVDPGFEGRINLKNAGFGWRPAGEGVGVKISVDTFEPKEGTRSLQLEWAGNSNPGVPVLSQTVLVEPRTSYRLRFSARTKDLVTGGLPLISIADASGDVNKVLAQSEPFPPSIAGWREYTLEFTTGDKTEAILIGLERQGCPGAVCPIFGRLWLDSFSLDKV